MRESHVPVGVALVGVASDEQLVAGELFGEFVDGVQQIRAVWNHGRFARIEERVDSDDHATAIDADEVSKRGVCFVEELFFSLSVSFLSTFNFSKALYS